MKILDLFENQKPADINDWSDQEILSFIKDNLSNLSGIGTYMSKKAQAYDKIRAVLNNLTNLSEAVMLEAVTFDHQTLYCFTKFNISLAVQLAAVQKYGRVIGCIPNPAPLIQWAAYKQDPSAFYHIQPPSCMIPEIKADYTKHFDVVTGQKLTETTESNNIGSMKTSTRLVRLLREQVPVNEWNDDDLIEYFQTRYNTDGGEISFWKILENDLTHMSNRVMLALINVSAEFYSSIVKFNPSVTVQLAAVQQTGYTIMHIDNPTPLIQWAACKTHPSAINYIKPVTSIDPSVLAKYQTVVWPETQEELAKIEDRKTKMMESIEFTDDPLDWTDGLSEEEQVEYVLKDPFFMNYVTCIDDLPRKVQLAVISRYSRAILHITNPDEDLWIAAAQQNPVFVLATLQAKQPSQKIKIAAVSIDGSSIRYIYPNERNIAVQLAAVQNDAEAIFDIDNPLPMIQAAALSGNPKAINWIHPPNCIVPELFEKYKSYFNYQDLLTESTTYDPNDWTEAEQIAYVKKYWENIKDINNPSFEVQMAAVQAASRAIKYITNPDIRVQLAAVQQNGRAIRFITNPDVRVQIAAVQQNGGAICHITNPTIPVQLAAVQQAGGTICYITNPTPLIQTAACFQDPTAINDIRPIESTNISLMKKYRDELNDERLAYLEQIENETLTESTKTPVVDYNSTDPNTWTEEEQIDYVSADGERIKYIDHPSEAVQLAAVEQDGWAISQIKYEDQSIKVQLLVAQDADNYTRIRYMRNPPPLVQFVACKNDPRAIKYIWPESCVDPSLLKKYGHLINNS